MPSHWVTSCLTTRVNGRRDLHKTKKISEFEDKTSVPQLKSCSESPGGGLSLLSSGSLGRLTWPDNICHPEENMRVFLVEITVLYYLYDALIGKLKIINFIVIVQQIKYDLCISI